MSKNYATSDAEQWTQIIRPNRKWFSVDFKEIASYKDLVYLFVYRDFISAYKQTILGPLWLLVQPLLTTIVFTVVFGKFAKLPTDNVPAILFYLAGVTCWTYFSDCFTKSATTLIDNAALFGKVYFPRVIVPIAIVISGLLKFSVNFAILIGAVLIVSSTGGYSASFGNLFWLPLLVVQMAALSLGLGLLFSAMSTKYRDLRFLIGFGVQLLMFGSAVLYPLSLVPEKYQVIMALNPMVTILESFRWILFGESSIGIINITVTCTLIAAVFLIGVLAFNRVESQFIDSV